MWVGVGMLLSMCLRACDGGGSAGWGREVWSDWLVRASVRSARCCAISSSNVVARVLMVEVSVFIVVVALALALVTDLYL